MGKHKYQRAKAELASDAVSVKNVPMTEMDIARRSFLSLVGRWSAAVAVIGLGSETLVEAVSGRSIISTAAAAGVGGGSARDRQLHPFPSDDPFNMPLGKNAYYASADDCATRQFTGRKMHITVNNGWSHPVFVATTRDPVHEFRHARFGENATRVVESYREDEDGGEFLYEHLPIDADTLSNLEGRDGYWDDHLHIMVGNELVELFRFRRDAEDSTKVRANRLVRNLLDHYCFSRYKFVNPLANTAGVRAYGGSALAGLIRKHEVDTENPHIPHAFAIAGARNAQSGQNGDGDRDSPLYGVRQMFPANNIDSGGSDWGPYDGTGCWRMGMRWALDPSVCTDEWIEANAPLLANGDKNKWAMAFAKAMRDYGCFLTDTSVTSSVFYGEEGISKGAEDGLRAGLNWVRPYVRRVAGAGPVHNPTESHWDTWRANGEGWGGGAPRVPYSPPLSSGVAPQSPGTINVTESRRFGDTA